jgi:hypothetical protein
MLVNALRFLARFAKLLAVIEIIFDPEDVNASSKFPTATPTVSCAPSLTPSYRPSNNIAELREVNVFRYTGSTETFVVPVGVAMLRIFMWGAGGGGYDLGGNGAYVEGDLPVTVGQQMTVLVGQGGYGGLAFGGGGYSAGGRSAIQIDNEDVVTAGGGGGGW